MKNKDYTEAEPLNHFTAEVKIRGCYNGWLVKHRDNDYVCTDFQQVIDLIYDKLCELNT